MLEQQEKSLSEIEEAIPDISEVIEHVEPIQISDKEDLGTLELELEKRLSVEVDKISKYYQQLMQARFLEFEKTIENLLDDTLCRVVASVEESARILSLYEENNSNISKEDADNIYKLPNDEIELGALNYDDTPPFTAEPVEIFDTTSYNQIRKWYLVIFFFIAFILALMFFMPNDTVKDFSKKTTVNLIKNKAIADDIKKDASISNSLPQVVNVEYVKKPYTRTFSEQTMQAVESVSGENELNETIIIEKDDIDPSMLVDMPS